jgi:hypothetical protein
MPLFNRKFSKTLMILSLIIPLLAISACSGNGIKSQPTPVKPKPTSLPTPTLSPDRVVLIAPVDSDPIIVQDAETLLRELASPSGLEFEKRESVAANEITRDIKVMVFLNHPDNLGSMATGAPATQFVAITDKDWNPGANVTVIRKREEHTAFMGGYIAAVLAPNFRVGALLTSENPSLAQAFVNGVYYYCGSCASVLNPLNRYPVISTQPAASPASAWQAGFDSINASKINVLYVSREASSAELMSHIAALDVAMIGNQTPPAEGKPKWVATIYADGVTPIRELWPDLLAGKGGKVVNAVLKITDNQYVSVNDGLVWLSQGKLAFIQKTMTSLQNGFINPLPVN